MKRIAIVLSSFLLSTSFGAGVVSKYDKEISKNSSTLNSMKQSGEKTDKKIQQLAAEIKQKNDQLNGIQSQIITLNKMLEQNKNTMEIANKEILILEKNSEDILKQKKDKEQKFINIICEDFSSTKAKEIKNLQTKNDVIATEIYSDLGGITKDELTKLDTEYLSINLDKTDKENKIGQIKIYIKDITNKKEYLAELEKTQLISIADLEKKHKEYQAELSKIQAAQNTLSNILKKLNVLKANEIKQEPTTTTTATKKARRSVIDDINETQKQNYKIVSPNINVDVRKIGSSTGDVRTARYNGQKTIAPIKDYELVKKFGKYFDSVYNYEFFNESVTLKPKEADSKVYCVLPGKVVYEKTNQSVLDNVVIIEHPNGIHTIYSHLDQISPTVETGRYIEKGYVIGRVSNTLKFQATQNSAYIDPMDLIN